MHPPDSDAIRRIGSDHPIHQKLYSESKLELFSENERRTLDLRMLEIEIYVRTQILRTPHHSLSTQRDKLVRIY